MNRGSRVACGALLVASACAPVLGVDADGYRAREDGGGSAGADAGGGGGVDGRGDTSVDASGGGSGSDGGGDVVRTDARDGAGDSADMGGPLDARDDDGGGRDGGDGRADANPSDTGADDSPSEGGSDANRNDVAVDASGGFDGSDGGRDAMADVPSDADAPSCTGTGLADGCSTGFNCYEGQCVAATVSCAAQKSSHPSSSDGVYWINPSGTPMRAYCDMMERTELCTEVAASHQGKTRDGSSLSFAMMSQLFWDQRECSIWAVRDASQGYPISPYVVSHALTTCQALGFVANGTLGACAFGSDPSYSNCGFTFALPFSLWGDFCDGCTENPGTFTMYVRMGPIRQSSVLTTFDGTVRTTCKVR